MATIAVISTGGKQYIVKDGSVLKVEKLPGASGDKINFDQVLLVGDEGGEIKIGAPFVSGASVDGAIIEQGRSKKVSVIKFKRKVRYKREHGHRQEYTKIKIEKISR
ncbi:MAG: 50S ribosomal protein L21 [Parcubacteria group bacterium GW2011_GWC2_45_7]|nr:MAG: 50S ribosomal protein L21 [Parcubacteria group bacterium GW2011_GWC2_45_7]KKU73956.1 MAG: 50S ribosomal protein L21 [Parcubacteria group bacterium GW2011_GWA2_47_26]